MSDPTKAYELTADQIYAMHRLLSLVHLDDLALSWLTLLPPEFHPRFVPDVVPTYEELMRLPVLPPVVLVSE